MQGRKESPQRRTHTPARASGEVSTLVRWEQLPGLELLLGDYRNHAFLPHWHDAYMLATSAGGSQRVRLKGASQVVASHRLLTLNPGELHDGEAAIPAEGWQFRALYLSEEIVRTLLHDGETFRNPVLETAVQPDTDLAGHFLRLHHGLQSASSQLERESILSYGLPRLFSNRRHALASPRMRGRSPGLERVREYIANEWHQAIPLDTLAVIAGMSRYHLLRTFRDTFGLPPHAYQLQLRTRHAKDLLFAGMSPSDVALATGFFDQAHLTNTLRRYTGATPGRLKNNPQ